MQGRGLMARSATAVLAVAAIAAVATPAQAAAKGGLEAEIIRNEQGIPTIEADSYKALGFGYGYAFAEDNICVIADTYLTSNAERSKWFGPDAESPEGFTNLDSDLFYQRIKDRGTVADLYTRKPPEGPKAEVQQVIKGYVAGYNRYLKDTGVAKIPDPTCAGQPWVRPITKMDVYQRFYELTLYASGGVAIDGIAEAQPPATSARPQAYSTARAAAAEVTPAETEQVAELGSELDFSGDTGSNAWGLGSEATATGGGMMLANPHFPWDGPRRFYQSHLVIPGELNVSGASLFGVPVVLIGHTEKLAWSHTVSTAFRFTPFQLTLDPNDPTSYLVDGQPRQMEQNTVTVEVKRPDGSVAPVSRTLYTTEYGPITNSIEGESLFAWTPSTAFALFDANADNTRLLNHYFDTDHAQSTKDLLAILRKYQGIPWVNTIAADSKGRTLYADIGAVPNVDDAKATECASALGQITFSQLGLPTLDGSRSECALTTDADSAAPGLMGASKQPFLERRDYVANSNDSYWLTNPEQPLEGFPRIIGSERTQRSLRTRLGLIMLRQRLAGEDGKQGDKFTANQIRRLVFQDRHYAGELWREQLVAYCNAHPTMVGSAGPVDVSGACAALAGWDEKVNLDSRGAILFARFMDKFGSGAGRFSTPFDLSAPVTTPAGLDTADPDLEPSLADAVTDLQAAGIPLDAAYGDFHTATRGAERIPIHGGEGGQGVFNAISDVWNPAAGYDDVRAGSSFVMVTSFDPATKCPRDRSILTYSLSANPNSEHFADQTRMFSQKQWVDPPFCPGEVARTAESVTVVHD
jgi:acyl-homoserine-lactone acylase